MNKFILIIIPLVVAINTYAQDVIYLTSGEQRTVIVKKVGVYTIEYLRFDNPQGALYEISKAEVSKIIYQNGVEDNFQQDIENKAKSTNTEKITGEFIDGRDSTVYKTIVIGQQTWMEENLKFKVGKSRCYYAENGNCDECGRFYTYDEAVTACPSGWHLPTDEDWIVLEMEVGMWEAEANKLGWRGTTPGQAPALIIKGSSGLEIMMCGALMQINMPVGKPKYEALYLNEEGYYWTSTDDDANSAMYRHLKDRLSIERDYLNKRHRLPIRCVKD